MWHSKTKQLVENGKLQTLGIVQEQHPDRAALYMQWQQMEWPVLADPYNLLAVKVVPITLLVDESGIIRYTNPSDQDLKKFLATNYPKTKVDTLDYSFDDRLQTLKEAAESKPKDAMTQFRYGVALRKRFDSKDRQKDDFAEALAAWQRALSLRPDQYIWRRRIQQYGPRLDKPYSFYDWVNQARKDLKARGHIVETLVAEPSGSEFAYPEKGKSKKTAPTEHPDPEKKVPADSTNLVDASIVVVPSTKGDGKAVRVHLRFKPSESKKAHWTNDAGNISFHFEKIDGVTIHDLQGPQDPPKKATSAEGRKIEFEIRPVKGKKLPSEVQGSAYYYVCEGAEGVCRYLRQPLTIQL